MVRFVQVNRAFCVRQINHLRCRQRLNGPSQLQLNFNVDDRGKQTLRGIQAIVFVSVSFLLNSSIQSPCNKHSVFWLIYDESDRNIRRIFCTLYACAGRMGIIIDIMLNNWNGYSKIKWITLLVGCLHVTNVLRQLSIYRVRCRKGTLKQAPPGNHSTKHNEYDVTRPMCFTLLLWQPGCLAVNVITSGDVMTCEFTTGLSSGRTCFCALARWLLHLLTFYKQVHMRWWMHVGENWPRSKI